MRIKIGDRIKYESGRKNVILGRIKHIVVWEEYNGETKTMLRCETSCHQGVVLLWGGKWCDLDKIKDVV